jgi:pyruvate kinase
VPTLCRLLEAGMSCARVSLSWGTKGYHERSLANLAEAMRQTKRLCRCASGAVLALVVMPNKRLQQEQGGPHALKALTAAVLLT